MTEGTTVSNNENVPEMVNNPAPGDLASTAVALVEESYHRRPLGRTNELLMTLSSADDEREVVFLLACLQAECLTALDRAWKLPEDDGTSSWVAEVMIGAVISAYRAGDVPKVRKVMDRLGMMGFEREATLTLVQRIADLLHELPNGATVLDAWLVGAWEVDEEPRA